MAESKEAASIFMDIVFFRTYLNLRQDIETIRLPEGFGEMADDPVKLSDWYLGLDDNQQMIVKEIVKLTIAEAVYRFLIILDNHIGYPIPGKISDFAVYLQTYQSLDDRSRNLPQEFIRLNLSNTPGYDDLQTVFFDRVRGEQE